MNFTTHGMANPALGNSFPFQKYVGKLPIIRLDKLERYIYN